MRVIVREIQYGDFDKGNLYCIKDKDLWIFTLSNYSWSLAVKNQKQLEDSMKMENSFQGYKKEVIEQMIEMLNE